MATSQYTGVTTADQTAAQNATASATANQSALSTAQPASMTSTVQPGIIAGAMNGTNTNAAGNQIDYTDQIQQLYKNNLGRDAEKDGLAFYQQQLASGKSLADIQRGFEASEEYKTLHAAPTKAATYTPVATPAPQQWNVTGNQTVAGNLADLIKPDNPYYQQWKTNGAQDAAARGFTGNSTLRDTGILSAVMSSATPIAQSDAATYSKAAGYNTDQVNQVSAANVAAQNAAGAANAAAQNALNTANISSNTQKYIADQSAATQQAIASMNNASQATISSAHDANSTLLANNSAAQQAYSAYVNAIANIDIQPSMDEAAKAAAINTQTQIFNSQMDALKAAQPGLAGTGSPLDTAIKQAGGVDVTDILNG